MGQNLTINEIQELTPDFKELCGISAIRPHYFASFGGGGGNPGAQP